MSQSMPHARTDVHRLTPRPAAKIPALPEPRKDWLSRPSPPKPETNPKGRKTALVLTLVAVLGVPGLLAATGHLFAALVTLGGVVVAGALLVKWGFWILDNIAGA